MPRRFAASVGGLVAGVGALDLVLLASGLLERGAGRYYALATALAVGSIVAWEPVARRGRGARVYDALSWAGFPLAALLLTASVPFFALSVYPPLEGRLFPPRVESIVPQEVIEVTFPRRVRPATPNVSFEGCILSAGFLQEERTAFEWPAPDRLRIQVGRLVRRLGIAWPRELLLNQNERVPLLTYEDGSELPALRVRVP